MRKRKQFTVKRVTTRSVAQLSKIIPNFSGPLNHSVELSLMEREEWEQKLVDNFWGLDKDLKDRNLEMNMMHHEDILSSELEWRERVLTQHRIWDEELVAQEAVALSKRSDHKAVQRTAHLKLINSPVSVEDLLSHIWNSNIEDMNLIIPPVTDSVMGFTAQLSPGGFGTSSLAGSSVMGSLAGGASGGGLTAGSSLLDNMKMPVHMDGLQRSREILDTAKGHYRKILKELKMSNQLNQHPSSASILAKSLPNLDHLPPPTGNMLPFITGGVVGSMVPSLGNDSSTIPTNSKSGQRTVLATVQETSKSFNILPPEPSMKFPIFPDLIEGHAVHNWDHEAMLHTAFKLLDSEQKGYLTLQDITRISSDVALHEILKYTVYGAIIKKKEWKFFESLFDPTLFPPYQGNSLVNHQQNSHDSRPVSTSNTMDQPNTYIPPLDRNMLSSKQSSQQHPQHSQQYPSISTQGNSSLTPAQRYALRPPTSITYYTWLEGALTLCREYHVPVRHIRTQDEHEYYANVTSLHQHSYWNLEQTGIIRDFRVMRQLQVGDCVWALHHESVRWIPAVIERIHYPEIALAVEIAAPPIPTIDFVKDQDSWVTAVEAGQHFTNYHTTNPTTANTTGTAGTAGTAGTSAAFTRTNTATASSGGSVGVMNMSDMPPGSPDGTFPGGSDSLCSSQNSSYYTNNTTNTNTISTSTLYYYDLWYPLNEKELQRSRMATTSRQLLTLPSENQVIGIPPKPYVAEKQVCAYAFDLMDHPGYGVLPINQVIEFMQSPELKNVVETSFVLSNIFRGKIIDIALENSIYNSLILEEYQQDRIGATQNRNYYTHKKKRKAKKRPHRVLTHLPSLLSVFVDTFSNTGGSQQEETSSEHALRVGEDGLSLTSGRNSKNGSKAGSRGNGNGGNGNGIGGNGGGLDGLENDSIVSEGSLLLVKGGGKSSGNGNTGNTNGNTNGNTGNTGNGNTNGNGIRPKSHQRVTIDDTASVGSTGSGTGTATGTGGATGGASKVVVATGGGGGSVNSYGAGEYSLDGFDDASSSLYSLQSKKSHTSTSKPPSARAIKPAVGDVPLHLDMLHTGTTHDGITTASSQSVNNSRPPTGRSTTSSTPLEGYVSKMDFLEFCEAVYNVLKYDVHKIHPKGLNTIAELSKQKPSTIKPPKKAAMRLPTLQRKKKKAVAAVAAPVVVVAAATTVAEGGTSSMKDGGGVDG